MKGGGWRRSHGRWRHPRWRRRWRMHWREGRCGWVRRGRRRRFRRREHNCRCSDRLDSHTEGRGQVVRGRHLNLRGGSSRVRCPRELELGINSDAARGDCNVRACHAGESVMQAAPESALVKVVHRTANVEAGHDEAASGGHRRQCSWWQLWWQLRWVGRRWKRGRLACSQHRSSKHLY